MWLPAKVRHLVLITRVPSSSSFPRLLLPLPPLSALCTLSCLFLERDLHVPWITLNWKQTHSFHQNPRKPKAFLRLCSRGERKTHSGLLIVEECLSKLWSYQARSVAREVVWSALGWEKGENGFAGKGVGSLNGEKENFTFCSHFLLYPSTPPRPVTPPRLPGVRFDFFDRLQSAGKFSSF